MYTRTLALLSISLIQLGLGSLAGAQEETQGTAAHEPESDRADLAPDIVRLDEHVMVVGSVENVEAIPGAAAFLGAEALEREKQGFDDVQRILRQVPGLVITEEDGYGLRPNIGMRGSGSERSSKITLLEDGVLIAPAPYAASSAYYFPVAGRMEALEVRKGSSQVKFGPRTNGGVLNLVSTSIPSRLEVNADAAFGSDRTGKLHANLGSSHRNFGWMVETYQMRSDGFKQLDGGGDTGFDISDYVGKFRLNSSPQATLHHQLELKLGYTTEHSDETYLGLTDEDFAAAPWRRYSGSQRDNIQWDHQQYQLRYYFATPGGFDATATLYRNDFKRNWYKLQSVLGTPLSDLLEDPSANEAALAIARGADSDVDALQVRANDREYYSQGLQASLGKRFSAGATNHVLEAGLRYHEDQEDRFQHQDGFGMTSGLMNQTSAGAPGSQSNRIGDAAAWAFFLEDKIRWGRLSLLPGVRYETIELVRTDYAGDDPSRIEATRIRENNVSVWVPGVGAHVELSSQITAFGGIHKGFGPPSPGSTQDVEAESSVNYELGLRGRGSEYSADVAFFFNDYSNLLGSDTLSSGGAGEGDQFNGGEVRVLGLETAATIDLGSLVGLSVGLPLRASYTYTAAEFESSFDSDYEAWGAVVGGDELPYLARHQLFAGLGIQGTRWSVGVDLHFQSRMRTQAGQGPIPLGQATDSYVVFNASVDYELTDTIRAFANVQNLTDSAYIVARRPSGVRPGLPRTVMAGVKLRLGR
jgi:Fe(3+) dicitrate transport protein